MTDKFNDYEYTFIYGVILECKYLFLINPC